jgi:hypothetical protein
MEAGDDCEIVKDMDDALTRNSGPAPDAVILGLMADEDAALVPTILARWPMTKIMTVGLSHDATLYELWPSRRDYGHISASEIAVKLREAVQRAANDLAGATGGSNAPGR